MAARVSSRTSLLLDGLLVAAVCVPLVVWSLRLWDAQGLDHLFWYNGEDECHTGMLVKGMIDNRWYLTNPRMGAPGEMELYDFPAADNLPMAMMKGVSLVGRSTGGRGDFATTMNVYFLLTFPLTAAAAYVAFRGVGVGRGAGGVAAILYAFLPGHFWRNEQQIFIGSYFVLPLVALVAVRLAIGQRMLGQAVAGGGSWKRFAPTEAGWWAVVACVLCSACGQYYPFFSMLLLLFAGVYGGWVGQRRWWTVVEGVGLAAVVGVGVVVNQLPSLIYLAREGQDPAAIIRSAAVLDVYALRIAWLILPVAGHRWAWLARMSEAYAAASGPVTESRWAGLGLIGTLGFVALLLTILFPREREVEGGSSRGVERSRVVRAMAAMTLAAVVFGMVGGVGPMMGALTSPVFRSLNRVSFFIAFFALAMVGFWLTRWGERWTGGWRGWAVGLACAGCVGVGVWDQTSPVFVPPYRAARAAADSDAEFVARVEAAMPARAAVFQIPCVPLPERRGPGVMQTYDLARAYLHSETLRWSYGAVYGRATFDWQWRVSSLPPEQFAAAIRAAGFGGVYLDRRGYAAPPLDARRPELEARLEALSDLPPIVSRDGNLVFFRLRA